MRSNSKEEKKKKKAEIEQNIQNFTCRVLVCSGTDVWLPVLRKSMMRW